MQRVVGLGIHKNPFCWVSTLLYEGGFVNGPLVFEGAGIFFYFVIVVLIGICDCGFYLLKKTVAGIGKARTIRRSVQHKTLFLRICSNRKCSFKNKVKSKDAGLLFCSIYFLIHSLKHTLLAGIKRWNKA